MILAFAEACFYKYWIQQDVAGSCSKYSGLIKPMLWLSRWKYLDTVKTLMLERSIKLSSVNCIKRPSHLTHLPHIVGFCMTLKWIGW